MVSARGGKFGYVVRSRWNAYRALIRKGMSKRSAARIANAGKTKAGRSRMSRKGHKKG